MGAYRQAVRLQPEDQQVQQGYLPDAVHHFAAEAKSDLDQQEGLNRSGEHMLTNGALSLRRQLVYFVRKQPILCRRKNADCVCVKQH